MACFSGVTTGTTWGYTDCCGVLQTGYNAGFDICLDTAYSYSGISVSTNACTVTCGALDATFSVTGVCENVGNGAIKKYYITDNLNSGESTRFSFSGTDRTCAMITINAVGSYTASNTANNHVAAQFMCRVFTNSSGDSADSTTVTTPFAYTYSTSNYTFTNSGSFGYTIDIANPTGDDGVTFFYEVIMHMGNPFSPHALTASSTV